MIKATLQVLDIQTDEVISERLVGYFPNEAIAEDIAFKNRKPHECVCLYGCSSSEPDEFDGWETQQAIDADSPIFKFVNKR